MTDLIPLPSLPGGGAYRGAGCPFCAVPPVTISGIPSLPGTGECSEPHGPSTDGHPCGSVTHRGA
jgi:hypothetical protein